MRMRRGRGGGRVRSVVGLRIGENRPKRKLYVGKIYQHASMREFVRSNKNSLYTVLFSAKAGQ